MLKQRLMLLGSRSRNEASGRGRRGRRLPDAIFFLKARYPRTIGAVFLGLATPEIATLFLGLVALK